MDATDAAIAQSLAQEHALSAQLLEALGQEEAALLDNDADALSQAAHGKSQLIASFVLLHQQLRRLLGQAGLPEQDSSMASWIARQGDPVIQQQWLELLDGAQRAQELNRTNGLLIQRLSVRNQAALAALRGPGGSDLYGQGGLTGLRTPFRTILG
jgi:flagella synthesis protein FlgN